MFLACVCTYVHTMVKIKGLRGMRMDRQRIELVEIVDVFGCMFGSEDRKYAQSLNSGKQARTTIAKSRLNKLSSCRHGTNACMYLLHTRALDGSTRRVVPFKFAVQRAPHFGQLSCLSVDSQLVRRSRRRRNNRPHC